MFLKALRLKKNRHFFGSDRFDVYDILVTSHEFGVGCVWGGVVGVCGGVGVWGGMWGCVLGGVGVFIFVEMHRGYQDLGLYIG